MSVTALVVAFAGGMVSLLSPCVLPVIPAYLSITTGLGMSVPQPGPQPNADAVLNGEPPSGGGRRSSVACWVSPG